MKTLVVTSQFLLKGHKMLNFLFAFFLKIFETLKGHISGKEVVISKAFFLVFGSLSFQIIKIINAYAV